MDRRSTLFALFVSLFALPSRTAKSGESDMTIKTDEALLQALRNPQSYRFAEQVVEKIDPHKTVHVTSAVNAKTGKPAYVEIRSGTMRIFRADGTRSADGKHGEITWTMGSETKKTKIKEPNAVVMAVRSLDGHLSWYPLQLDVRC